MSMDTELPSDIARPSRSKLMRVSTFTAGACAITDMWINITLKDQRVYQCWNILVLSWVATRTSCFLRFSPAYDFIVRVISMLLFFHLKSNQILSFVEPSLITYPTFCAVFREGENFGSEETHHVPRMEIFL